MCTVATLHDSEGLHLSLLFSSHIPINEEVDTPQLSRRFAVLHSLLVGLFGRATLSEYRGKHHFRRRPEETRY